MGAGGRLGRAVPGTGVLLEAIIGRQVEPAAHPPDRVRAVRAEEAHVHVRRRGVGIQRMMDDRDAHGAEAAAGELGAVMRRGRGQLAAADVREGDPTLLHDRAAGDHARAPAAAFGAGPLVGDVLRLAVDLFDDGAQAILKSDQIAPDEFGVHGASIRRPAGDRVNAHARGRSIHHVR